MMVSEIMKKIMVIGPSGAGKSEFSRKLNIDVYHLQNEKFAVHQQKRPPRKTAIVLVERVERKE